MNCRIVLYIEKKCFNKNLVACGSVKKSMFLPGSFFINPTISLFSPLPLFCRSPENIYLKLISVIRKYSLHGIKKKGKFYAAIIISRRLSYMVLFILFKAGHFISTWENFLSSAGKLAIPPFWFVILSSPLIPNQFDLGLPIFLCLPETFLNNIYFLIHHHKLCLR